LKVVIYYHDPIEVNPKCSWTGLSPILSSAELVDIRTVSVPEVKNLFGYARPDAVITVDDRPVLSIEQTAMNPSGHNIPQRFSFHVRAAELGVPSILYYPEYSRRTFSDPNVRFVQVRVPMAQRRLSEIYGIPAISVFWPTNPKTLLPDTNQSCHKQMARIAEALIVNGGSGKKPLTLPEVENAFSDMNRVIKAHRDAYSINPSVRAILPKGLQDVEIDPPTACSLFRTQTFVEQLTSLRNSPEWNEVRTRMLTREFTLLFTGTANAAKTDSEHPWPGYLSLLDVLYLRKPGGKCVTDRLTNLVYKLPVESSFFLHRVNSHSPPTATFIADSFSDLIILNGGVIAGRPIRGKGLAKCL
jgi:hypothetical protein